MRKADDFDQLVSEVSQLSLETKLGHNMRKHFQFEDKWINLNHGGIAFLGSTS